MIKSVKGFGIGDMFEYGGVKYVAIKFPTRYSVVGRNVPNAGKPSRCKVPISKITKIMKNNEKAFKALKEACEEFVRKVECGEARSKRSYKQMKEALSLIEDDKTETDG